MPPVDVTRPEPDPRNQQPLDNDFTVLIVPEAIPVPGTSVEVLQTAAANLRAAAEEVAEGGAGVESSWQALQAHYTAPESETLLAAMGPVARKGDTVLEDVTAVVTALETFAEEAESARTRLRNIRDDAVAFVEEVRDEEFWALNPWHYSKNRSLKLWANIVWATFQEAERECATAISAVNGQGNTYTAAGGEAPGPREIAYGLDPGEVPDIAFDLTEFSEWQRAGEEGWDHLTGSDKPWPLDWAADAFVAQQEHFGVGMAWGLGVGALSSTGLWRAGSGWAGGVGEVVDNAVTHKEETLQGYGALVGMYGEDGWMNPFDPEERSGQTWRENAGAAWTEVGHDLFPWREWEDRPAYTLSTAGGNLALTVVAFPVRGGMLLSRIGGGGPDIPDIDVLERPGVAWEPGAAARPGFSLAQTLSGIRTGFSDTATGIGLRLDQLSTGMAARFAHWEVVEGAPEPAGSGGPGGPGGESEPGTGPVPVHAGDGGVPDGRSGAPAAAVPAGRGDDVRVAELIADVERYSGMDAAERSALLDVRREALAGAGARGGGMEVPGGDGIGDRSDQIGDRSDQDFRVTAAHDPDPRPATPAPTPRDGAADIRAVPLHDDPAGASGREGADQGSGTAPHLIDESRSSISIAELLSDSFALDDRNNNFSERVGGDSSEPPRSRDDRDLLFEPDGQDESSASTVDGQDPDHPLEEWREHPFLASDALPDDLILEIKGAIDAVRSVHGFPEQMRSVTFQVMPQGMRASGVYEIRGRVVLFDPESPNLRATLVHEIGHAVDHLSPGFGLSSSSPSASQGMRQWRDSVSETRAIEEIAEAYRENPASEGLGYLNRRAEIWARSYTQWVALRSGDEILKLAIQRELSLGTVERYRQWEDEDFRVVAEALDTVFNDEWRW